MWKCDWTKLKDTLINIKELEEKARHHYINIRTYFYGGRTEGYKQYHKCVKKEKYMPSISFRSILQ